MKEFSRKNKNGYTVAEKQKFKKKDNRNVANSGVARNFKRGAKFSRFLGVFLRHNKSKADRETRKALGGSGGTLPWKKFENLQAVLAILVLFLITFSKTLFKIFNPNSECFATYNAPCSHIFDYARLRRRAYCYQRSLKLWKNCVGPASKTILKMAGERMHTPYPTPPASAPSGIK